MTRRGWIVFSILCIAILAGLVYMSRGSDVDVADVNSESVQKASDKNGNIGDHVYGTKTSKVIVVEYGDFQCPGCGQVSPVLKQVYEKYQDKVTFIFRNFPLYSIHPNALAAASAAEAAGLQGKFWEMHDRLYENQDAWKDLTSNDRTNYFKALANGMGIDAEKLVTDMDSDAVKAKIEYDRAIGVKQKVEGTPAIFVNGKEANQYIKDGRLVPAGTDGARQVFASAQTFEDFLIKPALEAAGIK